MKKHRFRPSPDRKVTYPHWKRDRRGNWRHEFEEVSEVGYCQRVCREPPGFHKGARTAACAS